MQKYWTKFQWIGLCGCGGQRRGAGQQGMVATWQQLRHFSYHFLGNWLVALCGTVGVLLYFFCVQLKNLHAKNYAKHLPKKETERTRQRERVGKGGKAERTRARTAEWVKEQQGENKFCFGLKVCAFLSPRWHFSFLHWTHNKRKAKRGKYQQQKTSHWATIETIEDHLQACCFCCCFRFHSRLVFRATLFEARFVREGKEDGEGRLSQPPLFLAVIEQQPRNKCGELFAKE